MAFKLLPEEPKQASISSESLHRIPAQAAKGALTALPGFAGDIASAANRFIAAPITEAIGQKSVPYEETALGKILPTTETHQKNLESAIPYLKPKNKIEQFANDVASDTTSLFLPSKGLAKIGLRGSSIPASFLNSLGANALGSGVSAFTGDETKGAYAKAGAMFLISALNKPGVQKEIGNLYSKADSLLPANATVNANRLSSELNGLKSRVLAGRQPGDLAASEKFVVDQADTVLRQVQNGQVNVNTLRSSLRSLNENLQKAVFDAPDKSTKVRARSLAKQINRSINGTLAEYGKTNPEWWKYQKGANDSFAALQQSNWVTNFIKNHAATETISHALSSALGIGATASGLLVPYQGAKIIYRMAKSPQLAKYYSRVVASAAAENATQMNKEIKSLDEELKKEEKKSSRYRLLD